MSRRRGRRGAASAMRTTGDCSSFCRAISLLILDGQCHLFVQDVRIDDIMLASFVHRQAGTSTSACARQLCAQTFSECAVHASVGSATAMNHSLHFYGSTPARQRAVMVLNLSSVLNPDDCCQACGHVSCAVPALACQQWLMHLCTVQVTRLAALLASTGWCSAS